EHVTHLHGREMKIRCDGGRCLANGSTVDIGDEREGEAQRHHPVPLAGWRFEWSGAAGNHREAWRPTLRGQLSIAVMPACRPAAGDLAIEASNTRNVFMSHKHIELADGVT